MEDIILQLIDIMKDLNKSIAMHIDNHGDSSMDATILDVAEAVSKDLGDLVYRVGS